MEYPSLHQYMYFFLLVIFEKVNIYSNKIAGYTFWESGSFENPHILEIFL